MAIGVKKIAKGGRCDDQEGQHELLKALVEQAGALPDVRRAGFELAFVYFLQYPVQFVGQGEGGGHGAAHEASDEGHEVVFFAHHELPQVGAHHIEGVELRIEGGADAEQQGNHAVEQHPVLGHLHGAGDAADADVADEVEEAVVERVEFDVTEVEALQFHFVLEEVAEGVNHLFGHLVGVLALGDEAHAAGRCHQCAGVVLHGGLYHLGNALPELLTEFGHGPEVEQHEGAVGFYQDVAGVWVGVIDPVLEHHAAIGPQQSAEDVPAVEAPGVELGGVADFHALVPGGGQHPSGAVVGVNLRDEEALFVQEVGRYPLHGLRLPPEVQFLLYHLAHLRVEVVHALDVVEKGDDLGEPLDDAEVHLRHLFDVGVLHFYHHLCAVGQRGPVRLPDGGGGERHFFKSAENLRGQFAKLFQHALLHLGERAWRQFVLQFLQWLLEFFRQKSTEDGEQLPYLDEQSLQLQNGTLYPFRIAQVELHDALFIPALAEEFFSQKVQGVAAHHLYGSSVGLADAPGGAEDV